MLWTINFCCNYSCTFFRVWVYWLCSSKDWNVCLFFFCKITQTQSDWMEIIWEHRFLRLSTDYVRFWTGHSNSLIHFHLKHYITTLVVYLRSLSRWKMNLRPSLNSFADRGLLCIWPHPSSHQLWPASLSRLKKINPIAWWCQHHVSWWRWYAHGDG